MFQYDNKFMTRLARNPINFVQCLVEWRRSQAYRKGDEQKEDG
jgi:hypothetical protein